MPACRRLRFESPARPFPEGPGWEGIRQGANARYSRGGRPVQEAESVAPAGGACTSGRPTNATSQNAPVKSDSRATTAPRGWGVRVGAAPDAVGSVLAKLLRFPTNN